MPVGGSELRGALYIGTIKSGKLKWAGNVVCMEEMENAYKILFGNPEVKRPLGRLRLRWEDNNKCILGK
jgi:hypothetical protein